MNKMLISIFVFVSLLQACNPVKKKKTDDPNQEKPYVKKVLEVGTQSNPGRLVVNYESAIPLGATVEWSWASDKEGILQLNEASMMGINCEINSFPINLNFSSSDGTLEDLTLPADLQIKKGVKYFLTLDISPNPCLGLSIMFTTMLVEQTPTPSPIPTPIPFPKIPVPIPEEGFLSEGPLPSFGGSISLNSPKQNIAYKDYILEVKTNKEIYRNAGSSSSVCPTLTKKLELIELANDGKILSRKDLYNDTLPLQSGKFYRIRWTVSNIKDCQFIYESFNLGYHN